MSPEIKSPNLSAGCSVQIESGIEVGSNRGTAFNAKATRTGEPVRVIVADLPPTRSKILAVLIVLPSLCQRQDGLGRRRDGQSGFGAVSQAESVGHSN